MIFQETKIPTLGKGTSSTQRCLSKGICLFPWKVSSFFWLKHLIFHVVAAHYFSAQGSMNYFGGIKQCKMYGNLDGFALQNALFGLVFR